MSKFKLGIIIFVTFIVGVGVGTLGSNSSTTGKIPSNNKEDIKQTTVQNNSGNSSTTPQPSPEIAGKVEVKSNSKKVQYGYPKIIGEVINNTTNSVTFVKVTATFYDSKGQVVGTNFTYAGDTGSTPLASQATAPFEVTGDSGLTFDTYKLDVTWQ